ncbi:MAG: hypothetical protein QCI00_05490 [Candidatus Thermoplasmatota archaeon]|nr:hypothetical protein [Candidatus Thermoplasmatota archaeon]
MVFLPIKKNRLKFVKKGRISVHGTTSKGKKYIRGKIYLKDDTDIGSRYQLFEIENLHLVGKNKQHRKGKGYLVFIPK